jgi:hypothetical protein
MGFFGLVFWLAVAWLAFRVLRRWGHCAAVGPRGYTPGWYSRERYDAPMTRASVPAPSGKDGQDYIDALESRVSELEERLDFTEQLLAERRQAENNA